MFLEQTATLEILRGGVFRRPIMKTMRKHFGEGVDLYAGRKGFTDLILGKGHSLEECSRHIRVDNILTALR